MSSDGSSRHRNSRSACAASLEVWAPVCFFEVPAPVSSDERLMRSSKNRPHVTLNRSSLTCAAVMLNCRLVGRPVKARGARGKTGTRVVALLQESSAAARFRRARSPHSARIVEAGHVELGHKPDITPGFSFVCTRFQSGGHRLQQVGSFNECHLVQSLGNRVLARTALSSRRFLR